MKITMHVLHCEETLTSWTLKWTKDWVTKLNSKLVLLCSMTKQTQILTTTSLLSKKEVPEPRDTTTVVTKIVTGAVAVSCAFWHHLVCSKPQKNLKQSTSSRRKLTYAHVCSRMPTKAHVCSRMLTYTHVCTDWHPRNQSQTRRKPKPFPSRANPNLSDLTGSIVWSIYYQRGRAAY